MGLDDLITSSASIRAQVFSQGDDQMGIAFIPEFQADELLYSVVARIAHYHQWSRTQANQIIFGAKAMQPISVDLPSKLPALMQALDGRGKSCEEIIADHTMLSYYTFHRADGMHDHYKKMMSNGNAVNGRIKSSTHAVPWPTRIRFCPECEAENRLKYGVSSWLRRHQLVTSVVCIKHFCALLEVDVVAASRMSSEYVVSGSGDVHGSPLIEGLSDWKFDIFRRITAYGHEMLMREGLVVAIGPNLASVVRRKGFVRGSRVDLAGFISEFYSFYDGIIRYWPALALHNCKANEHWLSVMLYGPRYFSSPVQWSLIDTFLRQIPDGGMRRAGVALMLPSTACERQSIVGKVDRDASFAEAVKLSAERLYEARPPKRVVKKHLFGAIRGLRSFVSRCDAPLTRGALALACETTESFHQRKLRAMFERAAHDGQVVSRRDAYMYVGSTGRAKASEFWSAYYQLGHEG